MLQHNLAIAAPSAEVVLAPRFAADAIPMVTHVRSTAIVASQGALLQLGLLERYAERLPSAHHFRRLQELQSATWVDQGLVHAHYRAIDALQLSEVSQTELATLVGTVVETYLTGTLQRMSRAVGITPWTYHPHAQRFWDRLCQGGDISIVRLGPKEAKLTYHGLPFAPSPYFRLANRVGCTLSLARVCKKVYMRELGHTATEVSYGQSWV